MDISLHPGELPSGYFLSTMLRVKNVEAGQFGEAWLHVWHVDRSGVCASASN